ncbi:hypothetical protein ECP029943810_0806 [Escherichia coli P0299438.10]|jgi:hypothetical protein|nr:hypothetical protein J444_2472 [Escherichia coli ACN001]EMZ63902.1 hypothetical protein EC174900_2635 [Escherichia coli 174900]ENB89953.1 hypothetical protein ECP029943810_0806 [Escherichia coli P0299438.10]ENC07257.1 hypothetical protein ECP02994384_0871 [Escherichia coli P0299438.4]ESS94841.1 hypothetical protein L342_1974 [Escherichia coli CE516]KDU15003.1 hypothetical protein AC58_1850 [Escherichia coli 3-105-05_S3_C3]KDV82584.1 hypothetical protein AC95_2303 [Escherichia coli 2-052-05
MIDILSLLILDVAIQRVLCRIQPGKPGKRQLIHLWMLF